MQTQAQNSAAPRQAILLTINTLFRRPLFLDTDGARAVARLHEAPAIWAQSRCLAWVLMPDHWQGLVVIGADDSLDRLVRRFKAISSRAVEPRFRVNGWLWSRGFIQERLHVEENVQAVARHLVASPVRSGFAKSVGAYPYWNAIWVDYQQPQAEFAADLLARGRANTMTG
jgi:REP element-mobilizing transposase RayT